MAFCARCDKNFDSTVKRTHIEFRDNTLTFDGLLCEKCAEELLNWLIKEDEN